MAHSTQQGFFVSMSTRGYSRSARAAEEGVALGQEALQAMLEQRPVDLRKDVGNDRPGDARRGGCGGANREGLVRLEDGHRASSLPRRWSLPCGPARRTEQIREGVVMQFGFFNDAESLGYDSVWVTDSQMIFSDCYAVLALAARQTRRIRLGPGTAICGTRIPAVHVAAMATLNRLAPGRVHMGIGTGNTAMRTMGQRPMRIAEYDEYLRVLAALLRGETVDYRYHDRVRPIRMLTNNAKYLGLEPKIPLYVSGFGPRAMELAGKHGDGLVFAIPPRGVAVADALGHARKGAESAGRAFDQFVNCALTNIALLEPGEPVDSERVIRTVGPNVMASVYYFYDEVHERGVDPPPFLRAVWKRYCALVEETPPEHRAFRT